MLLLLQGSLLLLLRLPPVLRPVWLVEAPLLYLEPSGVDGGLILVPCLLVISEAAVYCVIESPSECFPDPLKVVSMGEPSKHIARRQMYQ